MNAPVTSERLVSEITKLLNKHEVHNEVLACELAILVLQREKTTIKQGHRITKRVLNKITKG